MGTSSTASIKSNSKQLNRDASLNNINTNAGGNNIGNNVGGILGS
jgi:hypothetical protein